MWKFPPSKDYNVFLFLGAVPLRKADTGQWTLALAEHSQQPLPRQHVGSVPKATRWRPDSSADEDRVVESLVQFIRTSGGFIGKEDLLRFQSSIKMAGTVINSNGGLADFCKRHGLHLSGKNESLQISLNTTTAAATASVAAGVSTLFNIAITNSHSGEPSYKN